MIAVIDYGMGNVGSVLNMLRKLGVPARLTCDHSDVRHAAGLVLPGVGAFDEGMRNLAARDLRGPLEEAVLARRVPILGICLGMQLLTKGSEEGNLSGLGWIDAHTRRFRFEAGEQLRIPHMGWNYLSPRRQDGDGLAGRLLEGTAPNARFYFVHSFHALCHRPEDVIGTTTYGYEFAAAIGRDNIAGTQFHPEKSLRHGLELMRSYANCVEAATKR